MLMELSGDQNMRKFNETALRAFFLFDRFKNQKNILKYLFYI